MHIPLYPYCTQELEEFTAIYNGFIPPPDNETRTMYEESGTELPTSVTDTCVTSVKDQVRTYGHTIMVFKPFTLSPPPSSSPPPPLPPHALPTPRLGSVWILLDILSYRESRRTAMQSYWRLISLSLRTECSGLHRLDLQPFS